MNSSAIIQELFQLFESANPDFYKTYKEKRHLLSREESDQLTAMINTDMELLLAKLEKMTPDATALAA